jgi:N6-L-threonylcarbamoyladenine synthase
LLGQTLDDSPGEAFDKVARFLGLGYPGGPIIDRLASEGEELVKFPRPLMDAGLDFSFSGLKTAVVNYVKKHPEAATRDVAASFSAAVNDVLCQKLDRGLCQGIDKGVAVVGGVAASPPLRLRVAELAERHQVQLLLPPQRLATDNAAMIGVAGWDQYRTSGATPLDFGANPGLRIPWRST